MDPKTGPKVHDVGVHLWIPFFRSVGALWVPLGSPLGPLEALLGGLWTPKTLKTKNVLRLLEMQLFGSLKLLMALLGSSWSFLGRSGPKLGPKMGPKVVQQVIEK